MNSNTENKAVASGTVDNYCEVCKGSGCGICDATTGYLQYLAPFYQDGSRERNLADAGNEVLARRFHLTIQRSELYDN